jgi:hypothetical protein
VLDEGRQGAIRLDRLLENFRQADLGRPWGPKDEIMICPNMRAAQIYFRQRRPELFERVAHDVLMDRRIDQVIWRTGHTKADVEGHTVLTARGRLEFSMTEEAGASADVFGSRWSWQGDGDALGLLLDGAAIEFEQYPNAFERIAGVLDLEQSGDLWVTARPGYEFQVPGGKAHLGGASHGALHALDSLSPVIVAGGPVRPRLPRDLRSIDIAPICMELLGLPMRYRPGAPRPRVAPLPAPAKR